MIAGAARGGAQIAQQRGTARRRVGLLVIALCAVVALTNSLALVYVGPRIWVLCQLKALLHELGDTQFEISGGHSALVEHCYKRAGNTRGTGGSGMRKVLDMWNNNRQRPTRYKVLGANESLPHHIPPIPSCRYCYTCYIKGGQVTGALPHAPVTLSASRRRLWQSGAGRCRDGSDACGPRGEIPAAIADSSTPEEMHYLHRRLNHGGPMHAAEAADLGPPHQSGPSRRIWQLDDESTDREADAREEADDREDSQEADDELSTDERLEAGGEETDAQLGAGAEQQAEQLPGRGSAEQAQEQPAQGRSSEQRSQELKSPSMPPLRQRSSTPSVSFLDSLGAARAVGAAATKKQNLTDPRAHLPNCTECSACTHQLESLASKVDHWGLKFLLPGAGASRAWIFKANSAKGEGGKATAKVWCLPIDKSGNPVPACAHDTMDTQVTKLRALDRLIDDCGLRELFSRVWVERVRGIVPNYGYAVDSDGLFMNIASGVPLHQMTFGTPKHRMRDIIDIFQSVNSSLVVKAAIFDLLTSQCDRHAENVFIDNKLRLTLIDNDQMLGESWRRCGVDSIFLPTTQKFEINVHGYYYVMRQKYNGTKPKGVPNPQLLFDYRCHVPGGELARDYPPRVTACLRRIDGMSVKQAAEHYGFSPRQSTIIKVRAQAMLKHGFEWTLKHGEPQNPPGLQYPWQPSCCNVTYIGDATGRRDDFRCTDPWRPILADGKKMPWLKPPNPEALKEKRRKSEG